MAPAEGDERMVAKFLWLPCRLGAEWRWLEWAFIWQELRQITCLTPDVKPEHQGTYLMWVSVCWGEDAVNLDELGA